MKDFDTPEGFVTIIRWASMFNANGITPETFHLYENVTDITIMQVELLPGQSLQQEMRVVWPAGFSLRLNNDADIDYTLSGYLLSV